MPKNYVEKTVSSGLAVGVRARSYAEWEAMEEERLNLLDELSAPEMANSPRKVESLLTRRFHTLRGKLLSVQVRDFDKIKGELTLRDIAEIEETAKELEALEIPLGNSNPGGNIH